MGTYVMDMSAYLGQVLVIELCDEPAAGWAQAFFDEVVTYYEEALDWTSQYDTVKDGASDQTVDIPWTVAENLAPAAQGNSGTEPAETLAAETEEPAEAESAETPSPEESAEAEAGETPIPEETAAGNDVAP